MRLNMSATYTTVNAITLMISVASIIGSWIDGPSGRMIDGGWCSVRHQTTEKWTIGI